MGARKCAYQDEKIFEIESEWIKNKIKDDEELNRRIAKIEHFLKLLGDKANCRFDAIEGKEFCIFHDPDYWKTNEKEVGEKFLEELNKGESYFVGFHLPSIKLPEVIEQPLHMELAKIHGEFNANDVTFKEETWFNGAIFDNIASFDGAKFRNKTIFDDSFFSGEISFKNTIFLIGSINNSKYTDYISFRRVTFKEPEKVIFDGCNMKRVSFSHSDISRIKFINTKWGKDFRIFDEKLFLLKLNKKEFIKEQKDLLRKIISFAESMKLDEVIKAFEKGNVEISEEVEEIIYEPTIYEKLKLMKKYKGENKEKEYNYEKNKLEQYYNDYINKLKNKLNQIDKDVENEINTLKYFEFEDLTLDNALTVYRNLRENYDYYMKYEESGKFFLNEMKLKRKTLPKLSGEKIVMLLYEALALYGESYIRPLLALIAIVMTSFFIRLYVLQFNPNVIFNELLKSIDLFGLGSVSGNINIIERSTAIPILGMLIVALRRKLERRVRH